METHSFKEMLDYFERIWKSVVYEKCYDHIIFKTGFPDREEINCLAWFDENDMSHRIDGPAIVSYDIKFKHWYHHGRLHREDGPAIEYLEGRLFQSYYYWNGNRVTDNDHIELINRGNLTLEERAILELTYR